MELMDYPEVIIIIAMILTISICFILEYKSEKHDMSLKDKECLDNLAKEICAKNGYYFSAINKQMLNINYIGFYCTPDPREKEWIDYYYLKEDCLK